MDVIGAATKVHLEFAVNQLHNVDKELAIYGEIPLLASVTSRNPGMSCHAAFDLLGFGLHGRRADLHGSVLVQCAQGRPQRTPKSPP